MCVPLRLRLVQRTSKNQVALRRGEQEKIFVNMDELETVIPQLLDDIQKSLYNKALRLRGENLYGKGS